MESLLQQYSALCVDEQIGYFLLQQREDQVMCAHLRDYDQLRQNGPVSVYFSEQKTCLTV